jgi:hypothetical protein
MIYRTRYQNISNQGFLIHFFLKLKFFQSEVIAFEKADEPVLVIVYKVRKLTPRKPVEYNFLRSPTKKIF